MNLHETAETPPNAILVGIQLQGITESELQSSLDELTRLVTTLGHPVIGRMIQRRSSAKAMNVLGEGKLQELAKWTGGTGKVAPTFEKKKHKAALKFIKNKPAEAAGDETEAHEDDPDEVKERAGIVIVDSELSPSQLRNLESAAGTPVLDRTGVIIEIFSRHAKTKAARLQVEIAQLTYMAPRIRETSGGGDRQGGGLGNKGVGETAGEIERRKIRDRLKELREELESLGDEQSVRRNRREQELTVALVGYTNAGKSSLMRALTSSEVYIADKLFATLDTTVRTLYPETTPKILISDTVGFIKKLPHDLVASFKSTLDEAKHASLLLFVVDASDAAFRSQLEVTQSVLAEVGCEETPRYLVLNKVDCLEAEALAALKTEYPDAIFMSAKNSQDIASLHARLVKHFENAMRPIEIFVSYQEQGAMGDVRRKFRVISENFENDGVRLQIMAKADAVPKHWLVQSGFGKKS